MQISIEPASLGPLVCSLVQRLRERRIRVTVVGDIILDNAIEGEGAGVHPEFKVPLLKNATTSESIGGAANIALALARLGVQVTLFGPVGQDLPGRQAENLLDRHPFRSFLVRRRGWPTPRKDWLYRIASDGPHLVQRIDYDRPLLAEGRDDLLGEFRANCPEAIDLMILVDHDLGAIGPETFPILELARDRGAKIVAIPRSTVLRHQQLDAIVINEAEMRRLADAAPTADPRKLAADCAREFQRHVFLTRFDEGMDIFPAGPNAGQDMHFPLLSLPKYEWLGVRDITTAAAALGLALEVPLTDLGRLIAVFRHLVGAVRGNGRVFWKDIGAVVGINNLDELNLA